MCHTDESKIPVSSVFAEAFAEKASPAEFRLIDCGNTLDSGKTIAERFKLDLKQRPTIFLSGAVGPPQQIPVKHLKTGAMLSKVLRGKLEARTAKVETTQDLRSKCLDKDVCALLLKGSKTSPKYLKDAMSKLMTEFPQVVFASVDSTALYALNLEEHMVELRDEQPRFVVLKKVSGSLAPGSDRLITSIAALPTNGVGYGPMSNLVAGVVSGKTPLTKLSTLPVIKVRSKKLEDQERAKRERKLDQQRRQQEQTQKQQSPSANDGSRDGRRAERERRRAEHNAAHNVREKTPEEIAEIERKRRARMAEEAARWNMAPDDLPDEDPHDGSDSYEDFMEDLESEATPKDPNPDQDEEDVIDLD